MASSSFSSSKTRCAATATQGPSRVHESASEESIRFALDSNAALQVALANVKSLPLLRDFPPDDRGLIAVVVAELGSNILKYASPGAGTLSRIEHRGRAAIQRLAEEAGTRTHDDESAIEER